MSDLADRIRALRHTAGLSQATLADATGLSSGYISLLESGARIPSGNVVKVLARALATTEGYLLEGDRAASEQSTAAALAAAQRALDAGDPGTARDTITALDDADISHTYRLPLLRALGNAHELLGELDAAITTFERAVDVARLLDRPLDLAEIGMWLVGSYLEVGALDRAVTVGEEILAELRGHEVAGSDEHLRLGSTVMWAMFERGDYLHASYRAAELTAVAEDHGTDRGRGSVYWNAALIAQARGDNARGVTLAERALESLQRQGSVRDIPRMQTAYAFILLRCRPARADEALRELERSHDALSAIGSVVEVARNEIEQARAHLYLGQVDHAQQLAAGALASLEETVNLEVCEGHILLGDVAAFHGDLDRAEVLYRWAADRLTMMAASARAAGVLGALANRIAATGHHASAGPAYTAALAAAHIRALPRPARPSTQSAALPSATSSAPLR